jgi:hypothetical protein
LFGSPFNKLRNLDHSCVRYFFDHRPKARCALACRGSGRGAHWPDRDQLQCSSAPKRCPATSARTAGSSLRVVHRRVRRAGAGCSPSMIRPITPGANTDAPTALTGAIHVSRNGSLVPSPAFCDRKFEIVTPTSRMPLSGGKTDRIRPRATSCSLSLVSMLVSIDRLRVDI